MNWVREAILARRALLLLGVGLGQAAAAGPERPSPLVRGTQTGLPLPRFASVKARVANLRRGPGLRYPIDWVYHRPGLPVLILREFGDWRHLRMRDRTHGWMHRALLSSSRTFIVTAANVVLRASPRTGARAVARLQHAVVGRLRRSIPSTTPSTAPSTAWCEVEVGGYRGYLPQADIWGSDADAQSALKN